MNDDKRHFPRIPFNRDFSWHPQHSNDIKKGVLVNISEGGICAETADPMPADDLIFMELTIPTFNGVIVAKGNVAWTRQLNKAAKPAYHIGLAFDHIPDSQKKVMIDFIRRRSMASSHTRKVEEAPPQTDTPRQKPLVLIVDDMKDDCRVMVTLLSKWFRTETAYTGFDGVMAAQEKQPDVIIMDVRMSGLDGLDALSLLRDNPHTRAIPVIILTQIRGKDKIVAAKKYGAAGYLTKPYSPQSLLQKLISVLGLNAKSQDEAAAKTQ